MLNIISIHLAIYFFLLILYNVRDTDNSHKKQHINVMTVIQEDMIYLIIVILSSLSMNTLLYIYKTTIVIIENGKPVKYIISIYNSSGIFVLLFLYVISYLCCLFIPY